MKKITFFYEDIYIVGGAERVLSIIANELSKEYEVNVISMFKPKGLVKPEFSYDSNIKISYIMDHEEYYPIKNHLLKIRKNIKKFFNNYETDVFVCVSVRIVPFVLHEIKRFKSIVWEHGNSFEQIKFGLWRIGRYLGAKIADRVVVLSNKDRDNYIKKYHVDKNRIVRIYNPSDIKPLSDNYCTGSKKMITVGRIVKGKGLDYAVDISKRLFKKHPDWRWDIYGDGPYKDNLEKLIKEEDLEENLYLMGYAKNIKELYKEYAFYVSCSKTEGFSMVFIEAHNAKLPIVSFNINCGPDEIIIQNKNGYLIEPFNIDEMINKIEYLINNPNVRQEMSNNTDLDKEKLRIDSIINQWNTLIENL